MTAGKRLIAYGMILPRLEFTWRRRRPDVVVLANDSAYPGPEICRLLKRLEIPYILLQEGIRFPLPAEAFGPEYGGQGAAAICAWGEASASYFRSIAPSQTKVFATGTPRLESKSSAKPEAGVQSSGKQKLVVLTNPIDAQGFVSASEKIALFRNLLVGAKTIVDGGDLEIAVRHHGGELRSTYQTVIDELQMNASCTISDQSLDNLLAGANAAIIFASSVGLEVLMADIPLGVLELPHHGYVHDFVSQGAAIRIPQDSIGVAIDELLNGPSKRNTSERQKYVEVHLSRNNPVERIKSVINEIVGGANES